jgi:hypothetical protein
MIRQQQIALLCCVRTYLPKLHARPIGQGSCDDPTGHVARHRKGSASVDVGTCAWKWGVFITGLG